MWKRFYCQITIFTITHRLVFRLKAILKERHTYDCYEQHCCAWQNSYVWSFLFFQRTLISKISNEDIAGLLRYQLSHEIPHDSIRQRMLLEKKYALYTALPSCSDSIDIKTTNTVVASSCTELRGMVGLFLFRLQGVCRVQQQSLWL